MNPTTAAAHYRRLIAKGLLREAVTFAHRFEGTICKSEAAFDDYLDAL